MSLDIKKAFKIPISDNCWLQKLLIGGLFVFGVFILHFILGFINAIFDFSVNRAGSELLLLVNFAKLIFGLIAFILMTALYAVPQGYLVQVAHNEIKQESPSLPEWDNKFYDYFKFGLNIIAINFIYSFIISLILAIPTIIAGVIINLYQDNSLISAITIFFASIISFPFILIYLLVSPFIIMFYADEFTFQDAFKIDKILAAIYRVMPGYLASIGLSILIFLLIPLLLILLACTCIGIILIPFLILPLLIIVYDLFAQLYRESRVEL